MKTTVETEPARTASVLVISAHDLVDPKHGLMKGGPAG
jgi:hypothetical protein